MPTSTEICNLALSHDGVGKDIADLDTEKSANASACRRFYQPAVDEVFRDFNWPFANNFVALGLVTTSPNTDWGYSYTYPSDCRRIIKILSGVRNDSRESRVSYELAYGSSGTEIFTDRVNAWIKYNQIITDPGRFPPDFVMMLSLLLAAYIAPRVTAGDPFKLGERAFNLYLSSKKKSEANSFNEQQDDKPTEAESISSRET